MILAISVSCVLKHAKKPGHESNLIITSPKNVMTLDIAPHIIFVCFKFCVYTEKNVNV